MLTGLLLLAVGAAAYNSTQEVVVSSSPVRITGPAERTPPADEKEKAVVKPMPRAVEARGMNKMKKAFKKWMPYLMVPTMMALGYAPFVLSSLKMMVMNAVSINMMALNAAIFLTLRNMAFGPRLGQHVKYYNFGYSNNKKHHHHPHHHHPHRH